MVVQLSMIDMTLKEMESTDHLTPIRIALEYVRTNRLGRVVARTKPSGRLSIVSGHEIVVAALGLNLPTIEVEIVT